MAKLRLSVAARADLIEIRRYSITEFGSDTADIYFRGFNQIFALLRERPFVGAAQTDLEDGVRCVTHRRHRIFYRVEDGHIVILRIIHHARNAQRALRGGSHD